MGFGIKLFGQLLGISMGTNCAQVVPKLVLFCYERDFMVSLSEENQSELLKLSARRLDIWTIY